MKTIKFALVAAALAVGVVPAMALAAPKYHPGKPEYTPTPPPHAKAFGVYCKGESKKHVKGEKGTAFSRCVKRMNRAGDHKHMAPGQVCKGLSKDHVKGEKGTEFSRCVTAVAHLRRDERRKEREAAGVSVAKHPTGPPEGAGKPEGVPKGPGSGQGPVYAPGEPTPGPKAGLPEQAKAYGRYCQGKSKKHVKGERGTEFSRCVQEMARAAANEDLTPRQACQNESKKHVKGEKGTAFSRCVKAVAQLRKDEKEKEAAA
jgi:hypothetical protein